jgi:hypothetical protein
MRYVILVAFALLGKLLFDASLGDGINIVSSCCSDNHLRFPV